MTSSKGMASTKVNGFYPKEWRLLKEIASTKKEWLLLNEMASTKRNGFHVVKLLLVKGMASTKRNGSHGTAYCH